MWYGVWGLRLPHTCPLSHCSVLLYVVWGLGSASPSHLPSFSLQCTFACGMGSEVCVSLTLALFLIAVYFCMWYGVWGLRLPHTCPLSHCSVLLHVVWGLGSASPSHLPSFSLQCTFACGMGSGVCVSLTLALFLIAVYFCMW